MTKPTRAETLGRLVKDWRLDKGLNRPEAVNEMSKLGVDITPDYLNKLESGARSLTSASLEIREAIRTVLAVPKEVWDRKTGLHVPLPESGALEQIPIIRSTRTVPTYRLTVSGDRGGIVATDKRTYIDEDWEGDYEAYILESDDRYQITVIIRCQNTAKKGDEILCETKERGFVVATLAALVGDTYVLKNTEFDFLETRLPAIRGVVVRKQEDRL